MKTQAQVNQKVMDLRWQKGEVVVLTGRFLSWCEENGVDAGLRMWGADKLAKAIAKWRSNEELSVHTVSKLQRTYGAEKVNHVDAIPSVERVWHRDSLTDHAVEVLTNADEAVVLC